MTTYITVDRKRITARRPDAIRVVTVSVGRGVTRRTRYAAQVTINGPSVVRCDHGAGRPVDQRVWVETDAEVVLG